jgi:hypothetical protein
VAFPQSKASPSSGPASPSGSPASPSSSPASPRGSLAPHAERRSSSNQFDRSVVRVNPRWGTRGDKASTVPAVARVPQPRFSSLEARDAERRGLTGSRGPPGVASRVPARASGQALGRPPSPPPISEGRTTRANESWRDAAESPEGVPSGPERSRGRSAQERRGARGRAFPQRERRGAVPEGHPRRQPASQKPSES